jgi:hypothetical protein
MKILIVRLDFYSKPLYTLEALPKLFRSIAGGYLQALLQLLMINILARVS